ncbi:hypothetical protein EDB86DRAFT_3070398 [Lactarius hatsudake]|nr:hypothetical protein EDB86DRAFT_3070398 [Lactarius hatsudake]
MVLLHPSRALHANHPPVTEAVLKALCLCDNLYSFTWIDDTSVSPTAFLSFLDVLRGLPLRAITLRTYSDLGEDTWTLLNTFSNLQKVAVWCMNGPPRVLQGWAPLLGNTLTELELGGAPSSAIPDILTSLPALVALDTEYLRPGLLRPLGRDAQLPLLERLTVRTSSVDLQGPLQLWAWLRALTPHPSLESFTLYAFSTAGQMGIPRGFLLSLAGRHADTLRQILLNMTQLTLEDVQCVCELFPQLEELSCAVASRDAESIGCAIEKAHNLRSLKLHVYWIPTSRDGDNEFPSSYNTYALHSPNSPVARFGLADAETIMRRPAALPLAMVVPLRWCKESTSMGENENIENQTYMPRPRARPPRVGPPRAPPRPGANERVYLSSWEKTEENKAKKTDLAVALHYDL